MPERIAKVMAHAGLCSRRDAERWIAEGRVIVNGKKIVSPALNVDTASDQIIVDGKPLSAKEPTRMWLYHKPVDVITTHNDPKGRPTVFSQLPKDMPRVVSVGRLDINSEGLLLLTNDGEVAQRLMLPANGWVRAYRVRVYGDVTQDMLDGLQKGVTVDGEKYGPIEASIDKASSGKNHWVYFSLKEGKNREIRKVCAHLGLTVNRLIRVAYGPFELGNLAKGAVVEVSSDVIKKQLGKHVG